MRFLREELIAEEAPLGSPIALKLGTEQCMERYDPIVIAALYTRSFRDVLQMAAL